MLFWSSSLRPSVQCTSSCEEKAPTIFGQIPAHIDFYRTGSPLRTSFCWLHQGFGFRWNWGSWLL